MRTSRTCASRTRVTQRPPRRAGPGRPPLPLAGPRATTSSRSYYAVGSWRAKMAKTCPVLLAVRRKAHSMQTRSTSLPPRSYQATAAATGRSPARCRPSAAWARGLRASQSSGRSSPPRSSSSRATHRKGARRANCSTDSPHMSRSSISRGRRTARTLCGPTGCPNWTVNTPQQGGQIRVAARSPTHRTGTTCPKSEITPHCTYSSTYTHTLTVFLFPSFHIQKFSAYSAVYFSH
mmetsp:Transcript_16046/g.35549  ORF Transcript_16046/g.35549 Transcript_16046/m.35549 type:complete len:235 (-) Transcript_16046:63-767(-)